MIKIFGDKIDDQIFPKVIVNFINKLTGIKKIFISINMVSPSEIFMDDDDDWIRQDLIIQNGIHLFLILVLQKIWRI